MNINRGINHIGLTVPDIEAATAFFKEGLNGKIAYDSQRKNDVPRGGETVERILGLEKGAAIIHKRMMVFGNGPNIEMFEFKRIKVKRNHYRILVLRIFHFISRQNILMKLLNS